MYSDVVRSRAEYVTPTWIHVLAAKTRLVAGNDAAPRSNPPPHPQQNKLPAVKNKPNSALLARDPHFTMVARDTVDATVAADGFTHAVIVRDALPTGSADVGARFTPPDVPSK